MYDAYIIDDRQADRKHLRNLLVQYQIQNGVEARITGCTFADPLTPQTVTVMYLLDAADGRAQPVIAQVRAGQTQHHIVLTAPTFQQLIQAVTAETLPTGLLLKPVGAEELFRLLRAVEQPSVSQTQATYVWTVKARRYSIAQDAILYFESRSKRRFWSRQRRNMSFPRRWMRLRSSLAAALSARTAAIWSTSAIFCPMTQAR